MATLTNLTEIALKTNYNMESFWCIISPWLIGKLTSRLLKDYCQNGYARMNEKKFQQINKI